MCHPTYAACGPDARDAPIPRLLDDTQILAKRMVRAPRRDHGLSVTDVRSETQRSGDA